MQQWGIHLRLVREMAKKQVSFSVINMADEKKMQKMQGFYFSGE